MDSAIIDKIRKLHALAERAGTEHEAVHVIWHDGSRYAKVGPLPTVNEAAEFASKYLRMTITNAAYRPAAAASH